MNTYSFFLFTKLYEVVNGISDAPYDLLFDELREAYDRYYISAHNDKRKPEYECILSFLESYKSSNQ